MPNFKIKFLRSVTEVDEVTRVIAAGSIEEAESIASVMASDFNRNFPEDAVTGPPTETGAWGWDEVSPTLEELTEAPDGQA